LLLFIFLFRTKNEDGELKFIPYQGIKKKIIRNSSNQENKKVEELAEVE